MKRQNSLRNQPRTGRAAGLAIALLTAAVHSSLAQGTPDIVWQGAHNGAVHYTTFSPDGQQLASGGDDKKNNLWQATNGTPIRSITQCSGLRCGSPVFGIYSLDGRQLATSGIKFWNVADGTLARTVNIGGTTALSRDWRYIASSVNSGGAYGTQTRSITLLEVMGRRSGRTRTPAAARPFFCRTDNR